MEFVGWDYYSIYIHILWKFIIQMFETTNQLQDGHLQRL